MSKEKKLISDEVLKEMEEMMRGLIDNMELKLVGRDMNKKIRLLLLRQKGRGFILMKNLTDYCATFPENDDTRTIIGMMATVEEGLKIISQQLYEQFGNGKDISIELHNKIQALDHAYAFLQANIEGFIRDYNKELVKK